MPISTFREAEATLPRGEALREGEGAGEIVRRPLDSSAFAVTSKILSRRDLEFLLYEWLDVEALTERARYADHSRETFDAALDTCEKIATEKFAPHNRESDLHEPTFDGERVHMIPEVAEALRAFCDA